MRFSVVALLFISIMATSGPASAQEDPYSSESIATQPDSELSEIVQTLLAPEHGLQD